MGTVSRVLPRVGAVRLFVGLDFGRQVNHCFWSKTFQTFYDQDSGRLRHIWNILFGHNTGIPVDQKRVLAKFCTGAVSVC